MTWARPHAAPILSAHRDMGPQPCPDLAPWGRRQGESSRCRASSGAPRRGLGLSELQSPHLRSGRPVRVAGKGEAAEGREGHPELRGHCPPCDVTSCVGPAVPCSPGVVIQSGNHALGRGRWHLALTLGSVWPVGGTNRREGGEAACAQGTQVSWRGDGEAPGAQGRLGCGIWEFRWELRSWCGWGPTGTSGPCSPGALLLAGRSCSPSPAGRLQGRGGRRAAQEAGRGPAAGGHSAPLPTCSIHNGVIAVFQRKGLPDQELFSLNEGVR